MTFDKSKVQFVTNYHTRNMFYEDMVNRLYKRGWTNWYIQNTSNDPWGWYQGIQKPGIEVIQAGHQNIFTGLDRIQVEFQERCFGIEDGLDIFVHVDDDTYIKEDKMLTAYIEQLISGNYACIGPWCDYYRQGIQGMKSSLVFPIHSEYLPKESQCKDTASNPFISGCLAIFMKRYFLSYSLSDWANSQMQMQADGLKRGAFHTARMNADGWSSKKATAWTTDWFHIGNITILWYLLHGKIEYDHGNGIFLNGNKDKDLLFRIGYLLVQEKYFGLEVSYLLEKYFNITETDPDDCIQVWNIWSDLMPPMEEYVL